MEKELISIIVPVYNVEKFLPMIMERLLKQTYDNIEIILVDDGSSDASYVLCRKYEKKSDKVKVFKKKNGGAASARNYGFEKSIGQYVTFVDSDDWITEDYIEYLYKLIKENDADISICGYKKCFVYPKESLREKEPTVVLSSEEALENLLYRQYLTNSPWPKLLKRDIFKKAKFPEGKLYEDLAVVYKWFGMARKIAYSAEIKYYYLQRVGSSMHSNFNAQKWDLIVTSEEICKYVNKNYPALKKAADSRLFISSLQMIREVPFAAPFQNYRKQLKKNICFLRKGIWKDKKSDCKMKALVLATYLPYPILKFLGMLAAIMVMKLRIVQKY